MDDRQSAEFVRRLAAALRATDLYPATHPVVRRRADALAAAALDALIKSPALVIGVIGDDVVVDGVRLLDRSATLAGLARDLRDRDIEKVTLSRGLTRDETHGLLTACC